MRSKLLIAGALLAALLVAPMSWAQDSGRIEGRVAREDGSGLRGVTVVLNELGEVNITNSQGAFAFGNVPAGTYSVSFTLGDNADTQTGVVVAGDTVTLERTVPWDVSFVETITVFSASRRAERIVDAPAAVTVVSAEEIERQASHAQVPKLLEFTPGAEVTQSGIYDYNLNTRGFNSSLNRRVAVLIDGRDPSVPFLGAQEWGAFSFPLDDLASMEMVRGPSAALYGANASSGIVNLVTKQPKHSQGGVFRLTAGEVSTLNADLRWATELGSGWYFKLLAGVRNTGDFAKSRNGKAEYSIPCGPVPGQTDCLPQEAVPLNPEDDDQISFGTLRFDKYLANDTYFTFEAGQSTVEGPVFQTGIGRVQVVELDRPWARVNYSADHWNVMGYYNNRDASKQTAMASGTNLVLDTENYGVEIQGNWSFAEDQARLVIGGSYKEEEIETLDPATGRQSLVFAPIESDSQALFGQVDWSLSDKVKLVLAGRFDDSTLHDSQFSPKGSLVFSLNPNNTLRLTYNEAFQVANYSEFFLQANVAAPLNLQGLEAFCAPVGVSCGFAPGPTRLIASGNKDLELEETRSIELGYSGILNSKTFLTIDYYNSQNENFITDLISQLGTPLGRINANFGPYAPPAGLPAPLAGALLATLQGALGPFFPLLTNNLDGTPVLVFVSYTNFGDVDTQGIDVGWNTHFDNNWTFSFTGSWFDFDLGNVSPEFRSVLLPNSPETKGSIGVGYVGSNWDGSLSARWVDDFEWSVGPFQGDVKSYTTMDLTANYRINDTWTVGVNIANVTDDEHWESFGGDLIGRRALGHVALSW